MPSHREFVIYTDESDKDGRYFSNFYGGALVRSTETQMKRPRAPYALRRAPSGTWAFESSRVYTVSAEWPGPSTEIRRLWRKVA